MAAFNPLPLVQTVMSQAVAQALAPPDASALRLQQAQAQEAQVRAELAARDQALLARQAHDEAATAAEAAARQKAVREQLEADTAARGKALARDTAAARADQAARGIATGSTARSLLAGLHDAADDDLAQTGRVAQDRLEAIRRDLDARRQRNLLDLAEERQRSALTIHRAETATHFARHAGGGGSGSLVEEMLRRRF